VKTYVGGPLAFLRATWHKPPQQGMPRFRAQGGAAERLGTCKFLLCSLRKAVSYKKKVGVLCFLCRTKQGRFRLLLNLRICGGKLISTHGEKASGITRQKTVLGVFARPKNHNCGRGAAAHGAGVSPGGTGGGGDGAFSEGGALIAVGGQKGGGGPGIYRWRSLRSQIRRCRISLFGDGGGMEGGQFVFLRYGRLSARRFSGRGFHVCEVVSLPPFASHNFWNFGHTVKPPGGIGTTKNRGTGTKFCPGRRVDGDPNVRLPRDTWMPSAGGTGHQSPKKFILWNFLEGPGT